MRYNDEQLFPIGADERGLLLGWTKDQSATMVGWFKARIFVFGRGVMMKTLLASLLVWTWALPLLAQTATFTLDHNVFNPAKDKVVTSVFSASYSGNAKLSIYNSAGEFITTIFPNTSVAASIPVTVTWNGETPSGQKVTAGIYIFHLALGLGSYDKRLVVLQ
jgi:hypothetical protein